MQLLKCTALLQGGSVRCNFCNALPHCLGQWAVLVLQYTVSLPGAVGSATSATHCLTALGQWAVQLLQYTASLPWGSGHCDPCNTLLHYAGSGQCNS